MSGIFNNVYDSGKGPDKRFPPVEGFRGEVNGRDKATILPTVLKVTTEEIDYWTNMTCFYDKYWEFDSTFSTVPIAFMHITSIAETITAQGAEKRVIIYEAPAGTEEFEVSTSHPAYKNNLEVIMDNVVVQPKQYQMEVIIPDSLIGPFHKQGLARLESLLQYMELTDSPGSKKDLNYGAGETSLVDAVGNTLRGVQTFLGVVESTTSLVSKVLGATLGSSQMATINKNSLEAMASKGRVILFKRWTGYDYSYGLITKIDISKKPSEEGVYRGSITFQETPILNISQKKTSSFARNWQDTARYGIANAARVLNLALALPFMKVTGVIDEAGAPGTKDATGSVLDIF